MAAPEQSCYVFVQLPGTFGWVPCARLRVRDLGAGRFEGTFTYGSRYLQRPNVVALDPFHLPLTGRPQKFTKLKGIPGAVRDASADAWGRRVIQAKLQRTQADITEIEYLLNGPDDGAGNLRFGLSVTPPEAKSGFNRTHQLQHLIDAAQTLEENGRLPHEILEELEPGTSMGGARPKVTVEDNHKIWLAKLPEKDDRYNMQRIEFATLSLAREAGLNVCGTRLEQVGDLDVLMLERFDRVWNADANTYARYGLVSGLTVVDAEDGWLDRERWSYLLLADELRRWSAEPDEDRRELFRRMVFNAMVTNNDDHPRNHALGAHLRVGACPQPMTLFLWRLSRRSGAIWRSTRVTTAAPRACTTSFPGAKCSACRKTRRVGRWTRCWTLSGIGASASQPTASTLARSKCWTAQSCRRRST